VINAGDWRPLLKLVTMAPTFNHWSDAEMRSSITTKYSFVRVCALRGVQSSRNDPRREIISPCAIKPKPIERREFANQKEENPNGHSPFGTSS